MIRQELQTFAEYQEMILELNDWKDGWKYLTTYQLKKRIIEEILELTEAKTDYEIMQECADIANFCMMLHDNLLTKKMVKK